MRSTWTIAFVIFATLGAAAPATAQSCSPLQQFVSLDATVSRNGAILVPLGIDDIKGYFLLDFARPASGIVGQVADQLQKKRTEIDQNTTVYMGGQHVTEMVNVTLHFGATASPDWLGVIPQPVHGDQTIIGILGYDILRHFDVELDPVHKKVNLFSQDHCPGKVIYWTRSAPVAAVPFITRQTQAFLVPMQLDGTTLDVQIATDEDRDYLNARVAQLKFGITPATDGQDNSDPKPLSFKTLTVDGLTIMNPVVFPYGSVTAEACNGGARYHSAGLLKGETHQYTEICYGSPDFFLGRSALQHLHIYLAFGEKMLYATAADAQ